MSLLRLSLVLAAAASSVAWKPLPSGPPPFTCSVAAAAAGRLVVWGVGFVDAELNAGHAAWEYDAAKNKWRSLAPIRDAQGVVPVCGDRATSSPKEIFFTGTKEGSKDMGLAIYDAAKGKWRIATSKGAPSARQELDDGIFDPRLEGSRRI